MKAQCLAGMTMHYTQRDPMTPDRRMTLKQAAELFFGDSRHAATFDEVT